MVIDPLNRERSVPMPHRDKERYDAYQQVYRETHRHEQRAYSRVYRQEHPERVKATNSSYRQAHREELNIYYQTYREIHREELNGKGLARNVALSAEARRILGEKCGCPGCEVSEPAFLTIDHINGRPKGSKGSAAFQARASGWDKTEFQILCANCNMAKRDRGFCPVHQKRR